MYISKSSFIKLTPDLFSDVITEEFCHGADSGLDGRGGAAFPGHQLRDLQRVGDGAAAGHDGVASNLLVKNMRLSCEQILGNIDGRGSSS